jgi:hypothetical protein
MATTLKVLNLSATTSLTSSTPVVLYNPGGTKSALVSAITLLNNGTNAVDVFLTTGASGSPTFFKATLPGTTPGPATSVTVPDVITISGANSDQIKGSLSATGNVTCFIFGIERD